MKVWHWLTEPEHIPIFAAIVAFLAALIGGVLTQLVAGLFKTYGDSRQLKAADRVAEAAEKRWQHEQQQARRSYLLDARRDAYVRLLAALEDHWIAYFEYVNLEKQHNYEIYESTKILRGLTEEVSIYAPTVGSLLKELRTLEPQLSELTKENLKALMKPWDDKRETVNHAIRRDLGLEDSAEISHTKPRLDKGPASVDSNKSEPMAETGVRREG